MLSKLLLQLAEAHAPLALHARDVAWALWRFGSKETYARMSALSGDLLERYAADRTPLGLAARAIARCADVVVHAWLCEAQRRAGGCYLPEQIALYGRAHFDAIVLLTRALGLEAPAPTPPPGLRLIPDVPVGGVVGEGEEGSDPGIWPVVGEHSQTVTPPDAGGEVAR